MIARAGGRCERCGVDVARVAASVHHRTPRGMGGTRDAEINSPANLALLCGSGTTGCHGWVESHREQARSEGWLVSRGTPPASVPVLLHGATPTLLSPDGTYA